MMPYHFIFVTNLYKWFFIFSYIYLYFFQILLNKNVTYFTNIKKNKLFQIVFNYYIIYKSINKHFKILSDFSCTMSIFPNFNEFLNTKICLQVKILMNFQSNT